MEGKAAGASWSPSPREGEAATAGGWGSTSLYFLEQSSGVSRRGARQGKQQPYNLSSIRADFTLHMAKVTTVAG